MNKIVKKFSEGYDLLGTEKLSDKDLGDLRLMIILANDGIKLKYKGVHDREYMEKQLKLGNVLPEPE